jgi:superfamily I DNA and RNA helicase
MKLRLILVSCLLLVLPATSHAQSLSSITESDIQMMLDRTDKATKKGNVAGIIAPFAPDIKIKIYLTNPRTNKEVGTTFTKAQFAAALRLMFRRRLAYQYERKNTRVKIYDEQTATITSEIYETIKLSDGTVRAASSEVAYISLRNGKLVITEIEGRIRTY